MLRLRKGRETGQSAQSAPLFRMPKAESRGRALNSLDFEADEFFWFR
jgi:hypothetical protein